MAKDLIDYDPWTLTATYHHYDELTDKTTIETVQDMEPFLQTANELRKDDDYSKQGIKKEMWHYAHLPNAIIDKMLLEDGVNVFERGQEKEVLRLLNTKYSIYKVTRGRHS